MNGGLILNALSMGVSGGSTGGLFEQIVALPTVGVLYIYDDYYIVIKFDATGSVFPNTPSIQTSGTTSGGQTIAYISKEYVIKPAMWYCIAKGGYADNNIKVVNYGGYFTYNGYGKQKEYSYGSTYGVYLYSEYQMIGVPTYNLTINQYQGSIGSLGVTASISWNYNWINYSPDGSESGSGTSSDSMTMAYTYPSSLSTPVSNMTQAEAETFWADFAQACEDKRQQI